MLLARTEGIFTETAGGTTVGVLKKLVETGQLDTTSETVVINTGMGLKTLDAVADEVVGPARHHRPVVRRLRRHRHRLTRRAQSRARPATPTEEHPTVSVSVRIPTILRTYTGGESEVSAAGRHPRRGARRPRRQLRRHQGRILDEAGELRRFVNVYVGNDDVRFLENLETPTPDGAQISVIPAVAGGC